jgi:tetratricopeptide (TPR) repeat protein
MIRVPVLAWRELLPWGALALILLVTVAAYRGVVHNGFVLDDFSAVVDNRSLDSFGGAAEWLRFRPVLMASYALERMLWGDSAAGHHIGNLLVHAAVVVLTGVLARRLWRDQVSAVVAAAIVALHPLNAEAVNYIAARSSTLMTLWTLVAVWCYDVAWRGRSRTSRAGWLAGSMAAGLAAIGAKEAGVVLPLLIICWDRAADASRTWTTTLVRSTPFWAVIVLLLAFRAWMLGSAVGITPVGSAFQAIAFDAKVMLVSFGHWWWPMNLAIDYAWPNVIPTGEAIMWMVGAVATGVGTWALVRRGFQAGWCLVWFWASLLPIAVLPFIARLVLYQEHRSYLGGIALAWAAGWAASALWRAAAGRRAARAAGAAVLAGLATLAVQVDAGRTAVWRDVERVWEDSLAKYPDSTLGHNAKATWLAEAGRLEEARMELERSLAIDFSRPRTHGLLGALYGLMGRYERAVAEFEVALALSPTDPYARMNLGKAYEQTARPDQALAVYERLLRDHPGHAPALGRSGVILERAGRLAEAAERYRSVVALDPTDDTAREALGAVFLRLERWGEAEDVFTTLVARSPESGASWFNLGVAHERLGRDGEALEAYVRAAERSAQDPDPYFRIGMIQTRNGSWDAAAASYEEALARNPGHFFSHMNLALVAERLGDVPRAREHYRALLAMVPPDAEYGELVGQARAALTRLAGSTRVSPSRVNP